MIGRILGNRYDLVRELGSGGMAWVYLADDLVAGDDDLCHVAVKILYPQLSHDAAFLHRFLQEARLLVSLGEEESGGEESSIVPVLDYGADRDTHYLVMAYVPGRDLRRVLEEEGRLDWRRALDITRQVAGALERADGHGVVHRDVKPGNIMLLEGDRVRVLDFGVARARTSPTLTHSGFVGSPYYVAPEQAMGNAVDIRADLYSLGVVLYEMLCGRPPFESDTPWIVVNHHIATPPPPPGESCPDLPAPVSRLVLRALAKRPDDRFQTPGELIHAVDVVLAGGDPSAAWGAVTPAVPASGLQSGSRPPTPFLDALYAQGQQAEARGAWPDAVDVFSQVLKFDARYRDVAERLAEAGRQARLAALHKAAAEALKTDNRDEARVLLDEIYAASPGYRDVAALRRMVAALPAHATARHALPIEPCRAAPSAGRTRAAGRWIGTIGAVLLVACAALAVWALGGAFLSPPRTQPAAAAPEISTTSIPVARTTPWVPPWTPSAPATARPTATLVLRVTQPATTPTEEPTFTQPPPTLPPITDTPAATCGWIAFARFDEARRTYDVHACRPDGSDCRLLAARASQPAYLPGGRALAVHSWQPDDKGLVVVDAVGSQRVLWRITHQIEAARPAVDKAGRAVYHARDEGDRQARLWRSESGSASLLLHVGSALLGRAPAWTPDGQIVYAGCAGDACGILIVGAAGGAPRQLVAGGSETAPEVSPDGAHLAFMSRRDGNWEVYVAPTADGGSARRVTDHAANDGLPTWSPDGGWLAFVSDRGGVWAVWAVRVDAGESASIPIRLFLIGGPLDGQVDGAATHELHGWIEERISWGDW